MTIFLLFLACGDYDTNIDATSYNQTCFADEDCVSVFIGDVCGCTCTSVGINVSEIEKYYADREEKHAQCDQDQQILCGACIEIEAFCDEEKCNTRITEY